MILWQPSETFLVAITIIFIIAGYPKLSPNNLPINSSDINNAAAGEDSNKTPTPTPIQLPLPTATPITIPVDFIVNVSSHPALTVNIDLNDGMNREEAIQVAQETFDTAHSHATYELKSAEVNDSGVWTVSLPWGAVSPDGTQEGHSHFFTAKIDPETRTVEYSTCM